MNHQLSKRPEQGKGDVDRPFILHRQCESAAASYGFQSLELMATLPGVKLGLVPMSKQLRS